MSSDLNIPVSGTLNRYDELCPLQPNLYPQIQENNDNVHLSRSLLPTVCDLSSLTTIYISINYTGQIRTARTKSIVNPAASKLHYDYLDYSAKHKKDRVVAGLKELIEAQRGL